MKILIWVGCLFGITLLNVIIGEAIGFRLGSILLYLAIFFVAGKLCKKWDEHKAEKDYERNKQRLKEYFRKCPNCGYEAAFEGDCPRCGYTLPM